MSSLTSNKVQKIVYKAILEFKKDSKNAINKIRKNNRKPSIKSY